MKKIFLLIPVFFISGIMSFAQFNSGSIFLSGSTAFSADIGGQRWKSATAESDDSHRLTSISLTPAAGIFIVNRLAAGGMIDYVYSSQRTDDYKYGMCSSLIGPLVRYYINYSISGIMPYIQIDGGIGRIKEWDEYNGEGSDEDKYSLFRISAGPGINYFLNDNIAFETSLKYYIQNQKYKDPDYEFTYLNRGILFRFGLTFFFSSI